MRHIQLKREGQVVTEFDLYDLLLKGDKSKDARLLPGDVVYIPPAGPQVAVAGSVKNPAIYELNGEKTAGEICPTRGRPLRRCRRAARHPGADPRAQRARRPGSSAGRRGPGDRDRRWRRPARPHDHAALRQCGDAARQRRRIPAGFPGMKACGCAT